MFGILEKMDRFSNGLMCEAVKINFIQELIDNNMVWDMHKKYRDQAGKYLSVGKCADMVLYRKQPSDLEERYQAARLAGEC